MKKLKDVFIAAAGLAVLAVAGPGFAIAEKIVGHDIMTGMKAGF